MDRRGFLGLAATGGAGWALGCAPGQGELRGAPPTEPVPTSTPTTPPVGLADTGPALEGRVPRSLARSSAL